MKILSLSSIPLLPDLGSGKTRLNWTQGLVNCGHKVDVLQPNDYEIWPFLKRAKKYRLAVGVFLKARKLINSNHYDLIEYYGDEYWLLLFWVRICKNKRPLLVAHVDGIELFDIEKEQLFWSKSSKLEKWIYNITIKKLSELNFKYSDKFVCGCEDELKYVIKKRIFTPDNAVCISPGIDDDFHLLPFIKKNNFNVIFFGSWIERKGIKLIPQVLSVILAKHKTIKFELFGVGDGRTKILTNFEKKYHSRIGIYGGLPSKELINKLCESSIMFFPSYSEGFGLAVLEAMSCSIAVVTTPTGIGASLKNFENAIICDFDNVEQMVFSLEYLINESEQRNKIAQNGYNYAKRFIWRNQIDKLDSRYRQWCYEYNT